MQLDDGQHPCHEAGWDCLKIHIMQKMKNKRRSNNDYHYNEMKWSCFNVQYYIGLKAVWCYNVINFLCLVVFETPHQEIALNSPNHYKTKKWIKKEKRGKKALNTRSLPVSVIVVFFVFFYCDVFFYVDPVSLFLPTNHTTLGLLIFFFMWRNI